MAGKEMQMAGILQKDSKKPFFKGKGLKSFKTEGAVKDSSEILKLYKMADH